MTPVDSKIKRPQPPPLSQVLPAEPLLLMAAGPVPVPAEVARAGSMVINHVGDTMSMVVRHIREMGRYVFQTEDEKIYGVSGPASAAMEMAVGNLLWPGRRVLVLRNGLFSGRFAEMAEGVGADVTVIENPDGRPVGAELTAEALGKGDFMMDARVSIDQLNEMFDVAVEGDGFDTVGGFVYQRLGKIPSSGDTVEYDGLKIEVVSTVGRRLKRLRVLKSPLSASD